MPLLERVRVEVYLPDPHLPEYENLLRLLAQEFTYAFGGCSIVRGLEGSYLSMRGNLMSDQINLIYSDAPLALSLDFRSRRTIRARIETCSDGRVSRGSRPHYRRADLSCCLGSLPPNQELMVLFSRGDDDDLHS